jgi:hypothetical protein
MENVYIIWREDYSNEDDKCLSCGSYDTNKSIFRIFGSKQEAEEHLDHLNRECSFDNDEEIDWYVQYTYSLTEHRFG